MYTKWKLQKVWQRNRSGRLVEKTLPWDVGETGSRPCSSEGIVTCRKWNNSIRRHWEKPTLEKLVALWFKCSLGYGKLRFTFKNLFCLGFPHPTQLLNDSISYVGRQWSRGEEGEMFSFWILGGSHFHPVQNGGAGINLKMFGKKKKGIFCALLLSLSLNWCSPNGGEKGDSWKMCKEIFLRVICFISQGDIFNIFYFSA